jgi:hypothetical protein
MDFATRDRYRHVVERMAKRSRHSEGEVARQAIALARDGMAHKGCDDRVSHVGFYLIDKGLLQLERAAEVHLSLRETFQRMGSRFPLLGYLGTIFLITALLSGSLLEKAQGGGLYGWELALLGALVALCASHLAVALANCFATWLAAPESLPRMDFSTGIPRELRTLVVVPTMLSGTESVKNLLEALEVRFLANRDENLHFALLTDFRDAHEETLPEDASLLRLAQQGIEELNEKYGGATGGAPFLSIAPAGGMFNGVGWATSGSAESWQN